MFLPLKVKFLSSSSVRMLPCPGLEALCPLLGVSCPTCTLHAQFISPDYRDHFLLLSQILTYSICHSCPCLEWCFLEALNMALLSLCLLEVYTSDFLLVILFWGLSHLFCWHCWFVCCVQHATTCTWCGVDVGCQEHTTHSLGCHGKM